MAAELLARGTGWLEGSAQGESKTGALGPREAGPRGPGGDRERESWLYWTQQAHPQQAAPHF